MKSKTKKLLSAILMLSVVLSLISPIQAQAKKSGKNGGISYTAYDTGNGVVLILKNPKNYVQNVSAKVVYYNDRKKMIGTSSDSNYALEGKKKCAMYFNAPYDSSYQDIEYDSFKVNINAEKEQNVISRVSKISVSADEGEENVTVKAKNKAKEDLFSVQIAIVWYDENKEAIGYDYKHAECAKSKSTDYLTFDFPHDSNYETVYPDSYEIFVNDAYTYSWMK